MHDVVSVHFFSNLSIINLGRKRETKTKRAETSSRRGKRVMPKHFKKVCQQPFDKSIVSRRILILNKHHLSTLVALKRIYFIETKNVMLEMQ